MIDSRLTASVRRYERHKAKRAKKVADRKTRIAEWRKVCAEVKTRDGGLCRICGTPTRSSGHPALLAHCHHLVYRSLGRDDSPENLIHVHAGCHEAIHLKLVRLQGTASNLYVQDERGDHAPVH